jgi:hypothetical protein
VQLNTEGKSADNQPSGEAETNEYNLKNSYSTSMVCIDIFHSSLCYASRVYHKMGIECLPKLKPGRKLKLPPSGSISKIHI